MGGGCFFYSHGVIRLREMTREAIPFLFILFILVGVRLVFFGGNVIVNGRPIPPPTRPPLRPTPRTPPSAPLAHHPSCSETFLP